jgi:tetratricopeptide (TPR) repeat protein
MSITSAEEQQKAALAPKEILGITLTPRPASEFYAEQAVNRGKEEIAKGHYWDAQQSFQEALHSDPRDPYQARMLLALTCLYEGRVDQAIEVLECDLLASGQPESVSLVLYLWGHLCQCATRADFLARVQTWFPSESGRDPLDSLEEMGTALPESSTMELYLLLLLFVREHYRQCLQDLVELRETWTGPYPWLLTFWEALSRAFLEEEEQASGVLQKAIEEGIPHALLLPLRWLKEKHCRPAFFDEAIRPLFVQYRLPYRESWGQKDRKKNRQAHTTSQSGGIQ